MVREPTSDRDEGVGGSIRVLVSASNPSVYLRSVGLLDVSELNVRLSGKDACYGVREWRIRNGGNPVGLARRTKGLAAVFSGLRHRVPIEVLDWDAKVLCVVRRSRAPKSFCRTYRVCNVDGELLGVLRSRSFRNEDGRQESVVDIEDGQERVLASRSSLRPAGGPEWVADDDRWSSVTTSVEPQQSWASASTWSVDGMDALSADRRLLLVAVHLVRGPWSSGESQSSNNTYR
jgi:hypothetical protein